MLSKAKIKYIRSLEVKKFRNEYQTFVAEGNKLVAELINQFECELLVAKTSWLATQGNIQTDELLMDDEGEGIKKASFLKTPQDVLAVFKQPIYSLADINTDEGLVLALDGIQDPGNLGTIIRIADWFGIRHIVCSTDTTDAFSPKTVQATMGALARVQIHYTDLSSYLGEQKTAIFGSFLDGEDIYTKHLPQSGIIVMGNEGNGIRNSVEETITDRLFIPPFPAEQETSESLNVAVATAIICSEFRRQNRDSEVITNQTK